MDIDVDRTASRTVEMLGLLLELLQWTRGGDSKQWAIGEDITDELVVGSG
jgi:hypothetical protein